MTEELLEFSKGPEVLVSVTGCLPPGHCNMDGSRVSAIVYAPLDTADADRSRVSDVVYISSTHYHCRCEQGELYCLCSPFTLIMWTEQNQGVHTSFRCDADSFSAPYPHPDMPVRDPAVPPRWYNVTFMCIQPFCTLSIPGCPVYMVRALCQLRRPLDCIHPL